MSELDDLLKEMAVLRQREPTHPILAALDAYLPNQPGDNLLDSILDNDTTDVGYTSQLNLSPLLVEIDIFGVTMLIMQAFQAYKEKYVKNAPENDDWKTRFLKYAEVDLQTANQMGRQVHLDVERWDTNKNDIMFELYEIYVTQNYEAKATLYQAPDKIEEDTLPDPYWGTPGNHIGQILQKLQTELRDAAETTRETQRRRTNERETCPCDTPDTGLY